MDMLKAEWLKRPIWMNLLFLFCLFMTLIYSPFDIFTKPYDEWRDVWFGYTLTGWWAKAGEQVHWLVYGFGAYGFWKMKSWMWPWAAMYCAQVAIAMVVFSLLRAMELGELTGKSLMPALVVGSVFAVPTIALWRARGRFQGDPGAG
jgi:hypothetical protein